MLQKLFYLSVAMIITQNAIAQNLPSLLTGRDINSTFAIAGYDEMNQEWGIAVATNNIYVGNSTIYIQPGAGAIAVIAETNPEYGTEGLSQLELGKTPKQSIEQVLKNDTLSDYRQVGIIDREGTTYGYTGHALSYWNGNAGYKQGYHCIALGNQLGKEVLDNMIKEFETTRGTLAERLLAGLVAGQRAGGQITGKQSAALMVKGEDMSWFNRVDLRVDNSRTPFEDLQRLLNYHYGRKMLNQSIDLIKDGEIAQGALLLKTAETKIQGWAGLYGKLATGYVLINDDKKALDIILAAMKIENDWKTNLPAFYYLRNYDAYKSLVDPDTFSEKDWCSAIEQDINMLKMKDAMEIIERADNKYPKSIAITYLTGKAYLTCLEFSKAERYFKRTLQMDPDHEDAKRGLKTLSRIR